MYMGNLHVNINYLHATSQYKRTSSQEARVIGGLKHGRPIREQPCHAWIVTGARRNAYRGKTLSLLTRDMPSLFDAYRSSNASNGRNMRLFEIKNTL